MNKEKLLNEWLQEEKVAHIQGWDFSHIAGKYDEESDLPWNYKKIINRYLLSNWRVLKPKGIFITEQVGAENDRELIKLLLNNVYPIPFPKQYLKTIKHSFEKIGFKTIESDEAFRPIKFWDVGALVWFAHIIEWEFPGFNVTDCLPNLYHAQEILEQNGVIEGRIHRFLLVVQK